MPAIDFVVLALPAIGDVELQETRSVAEHVDSRTIPANLDRHPKPEHSCGIALSPPCRESRSRLTLRHVA